MSLRCTTSMRYNQKDKVEVLFLRMDSGCGLAKGSTPISRNAQEPEELLDPVATSSLTRLPNEETPISVVKGQLLTQALPPYLPSAVSGEQLFGCPDCGDRFLLEASLVRHLDRRSVFIAYGCRICGCGLEFYNRCALLAHIRGHSHSGVSPIEQLSTLPKEKMILGSLINYENGDKASTAQSLTIVEPDSLLLSPVPRSKIDIGPFVPIPVDEYGRLLSKNVSKVSEVERISQGVQVTDGCDLSNVAEKPSESIQPSISLAEQKGDKQAVNSPSQSQSSNEGTKSTSSTVNTQKESESVQPSKLSTDPPSLDVLVSETEVQPSKECKECGKIPDGDLKDHYQSFNAPLLTELSCTLCKLILPSRCSLLAHKRIHLQKRPFICPECAREFGMWASFYVHMLYTCFHMFKEVRYRCMHCRCLFASELGLQTHLVASHVKHVFKCDVCPIACFSTQTLREHKVNTHGQSVLSTHSYQQCQLCPDRLIPKHKILSHVTEHSAYPAVRVYVYKCNSCSQFTLKKTDFATHKSHCRMENIKAQSQVSKSNMLTNKYFVGKNSNQKNIFKVFCEMPQPNNNMKISFAPKSVVQKVNVNKVILPDSEPKEIQSGTVVSNKNANKLHFKDSEGKIVVSKFSLLKGKSLVPAEDKGSVVMKREQIYVSGGLKSKKFKQHDSGAASLSKTDKKGKEQDTIVVRAEEDSRTPENPISSVEGVGKAENILINSKKIIQSCAVCNKNIPYYVQSPFKTRLPVICATCSRDHAFVRKAGKLLIVPKKSLASFMKASDVINGKTKDMSEKTAVNTNCDIDTNTAVNSIICPLCDMHISMEYDKIGEHYREKHPDRKFLFPLAYKLKINNTVMNPSSPSDGDINLPREILKESSNAASEDDLRKDGQLSKRSLDKDDEIQNGGDSESKRKKKSLLNVTENDNEKASSINCGQELPLPESGERKFICFKCKYTDRNEKSFREHILKHRNDDNAYQCMECGMCFVVRPSFEKHLFIWHRIKDAEAYIQANDCCDRSLREESPEDFDGLYSFDEGEENVQDSLSENQCRVCKEMFENPSQLTLHFRTHGMAFLHMKRREIRQTHSANNVKL